MWTCPECGKKFRNKNQWHSCYILSLNDHLKNKPENIRNTVIQLIKKIEKFGAIQMNPVRSVIQLKAGATFLSIKPRKNHVELEFQLGRRIDEFPIHQAVKISGKRFLHFLYLQDPEDIDEILITWLHESYHLISDT